MSEIRDETMVQGQACNVTDLLVMHRALIVGIEAATGITLAGWEIAY